ncbi:MAG: carboxymuconolactone decarboxylase family protein [Planctomycetota bacterium]|jgi:uncharacterized peroxidase-related enzyme
MPRLNPLPPDQIQGKTKTLLDGVQQKLGTTPNIFRTLAHSPAALEAYLSLGRALSGASLSALLRERIALVVANANGCQYCVSAHTAIGKRLGLDAVDLTASLEGTSSDPKVAPALRFARSIVTKRGWVDDAEVQDVRDAGYSDGEIAEIIATVAQNIFSNYFNHIAQTEIDFPKVDIAQPAPG